MRFYHVGNARTGDRCSRGTQGGIGITPEREIGILWDRHRCDPMIRPRPSNDLPKRRSGCQRGAPRHGRTAMVREQRDFATNPLLDRIAINHNVCGGRPCIKGTRLWVSLVLDFLADGTTETQLRAEYPQLTHEDVLAAIAHGSEAARERIVPCRPAALREVQARREHWASRTGAARSSRSRCDDRTRAGFGRRR